MPTFMSNTVISPIIITILLVLKISTTNVTSAQLFGEYSGFSIACLLFRYRKFVPNQLLLGSLEPLDESLNCHFLSRLTSASFWEEEKKPKTVSNSSVFTLKLGQNRFFFFFNRSPTFFCCVFDFIAI